MNSSSRVQTSLTGLPAALRQPGRLDGRLAGVLAAVAGARVGHDHAHVVLGDAEGAGQLAADAERPLRAGPDGELAVGPLRDGRPRLERRVGDVGDRVGRLDGRDRPRFKPVRRSSRAFAWPRAEAAVRRRRRVCAS